MGYLQRKKFLLLHFLIFKSYFYAYFSHHITGPKFIGGGRGQTRFSQKPKFVIFFFFEAFPYSTPKGKALHRLGEGGVKMSNRVWKGVYLP